PRRAGQNFYNLEESIMGHDPNGKFFLDALETRVLLSVAAGATLSSAGVLSVRGAKATANDISVKLSSDGTTIQTAENSLTQSFAAADVKRVIVTGGDAADT